MSEEYGVWRDVETGVNPAWGVPTNADGATDQAGDPGAPIYTRLEGPYGLPWYDGMEQPNSPTGLFASPDPSMPFPDRGAVPVVGAYEGAVRTHGPVRPWGHEPSGGIWGDQAIGRIMRFPANAPFRYDPNGVFTTDVKDEMGSQLWLDAMTSTDSSNTNLIQDLLSWTPNG